MGIRCLVVATARRHDDFEFLIHEPRCGAISRGSRRAAPAGLPRGAARVGAGGGYGGAEFAGYPARAPTHEDEELWPALVEDARTPRRLSPAMEGRSTRWSRRCWPRRRSPMANLSRPAFALDAITLWLNRWTSHLAHEEQAAVPLAEEYLAAYLPGFESGGRPRAGWGGPGSCRGCWDGADPEHAAVGCSASYRRRCGPRSAITCAARTGDRVLAGGRAGVNGRGDRVDPEKNHAVSPPALCGAGDAGSIQSQLAGNRAVRRILFARRRIRPANSCSGAQRPIPVYGRGASSAGRQSERDATDRRYETARAQATGQCGRRARRRASRTTAACRRGRVAMAVSAVVEARRCAPRQMHLADRSREANGRLAPTGTSAPPMPPSAVQSNTCSPAGMSVPVPSPVRSQDTSSRGRAGNQPSFGEGRRGIRRAVATRSPTGPQVTRVRHPSPTAV